MTVEQQEVYSVRKKEDSETRKCYNCSKMGHIARDCPTGMPVVKNITEQGLEAKDRKKISRISDIVREAQSKGIRTGKLSSVTNLVGKKSSAYVKMLNEKFLALIDTGSLVSIVPVGLLEKAQQSGFDVDYLEVIDPKTLDPVFDASNNRMEFLGGVFITVSMEGGAETDVAFYISKEKGEEVLIATNAMKGLGIQITLPQPVKEPVRKICDSGKASVLRRTYIPPYGSAMVQLHCDVEEDKVERVVWPLSKRIAAGVFKIEKRECTIPVINDRSEPLLLREGEEIGNWSTENGREDGRNSNQ